MSGFERIFKRSRLKPFEKALRKANQKVGNPEFSADRDKLGFPRCPECNAPFLSGFGNSSGDYYLCLKCGSVIAVDSGNGNK